jgi:ADP-ribose pyrophosphatase YjhB (NUDIX family)
MDSDLQPIWLSYAKRLHAIASTGEHFTAHVYDRERYAEIGAIASQMLASLADAPVERIPGLFPSYAKGYATPQVDVRGAVIRDGRILLVREASDGRWTMPGGYAEVGLSLTQNVIKEIEEEAGIEARVVRLLGIRHKAAHAYKPDIRDFYKIFFLCECDQGAQPQSGVETTEAGFFSLESLPPLSTGRTIEKDILAAIEAGQSPGSQVFFD